MNNRLPPTVDWSCRLYARLLTLLPGRFRQDYDRPILQTFRDLCVEAWQARGAWGLVPVWLQALPDLAEGAAGEWHFELVIGGKMERVSVRTGLLLALMVCAAALAVAVLPHEAKAVVALLALVGFMAVAVSGWRSRYWQTAAASAAASETAADTGRGLGDLIRPVLIGTELVFLALFVYVMRFLFPAQPGPAVAHRLIINEELMNTATSLGDFLTVLIIILAGYLAVTVLATRGRGQRARPWLVGVTVGGVGGLAMVVVVLATGADTLTQLLVAGATAGLAGLIAGQLTGQTEAGALGGFWCGLAFALVWATAGMVLDLTLAPQLAGTGWAASHLACQGLAGHELAACAAGGDVFGWGRLLLGLPILGAGLGVIGGLWGAAFTRARKPVEAAWGWALVPAVVFCGGMMLVFAVRTATALLQR